MQVRDLIAHRIADGVWKPGNVLPNEQEFARELSVSVGTVRKALDQLEDERVVVRRQGRGTFVVDQATDAAANRFCNVVDMDGRPIAGVVQVLDRRTAPASPEERERLDLPPGEEVLRTRQVRFLSSRPFMLEDAALAVGRLPGLPPIAPAAYKIAALAQASGVHLAKAVERATLVRAPADVAEHLQLAPQTALLKLDRTIQALDGTLVEWRVAHCHLREGQFYAAEMR